MCVLAMPRRNVWAANNGFTIVWAAIYNSSETEEPNLWSIMHAHTTMISKHFFSTCVIWVGEQSDDSLSETSLSYLMYIVIY